MKHLILYTLAVLFIAGLPSAIAASQATPSSTAQNQVAATSPIRDKQPTGDDVFKANCARCHMPPTAISPRLTGTIIMHMRTRARLSRQDEQLLLKYMAP